MTKNPNSISQIRPTILPSGTPYHVGKYLALEFYCFYDNVLLLRNTVHSSVFINYNRNNIIFSTIIKYKLYKILSVKLNNFKLNALLITQINALSLTEIKKLNAIRL